MEIAWLAFLGILFAGYLVLGGLDYGVGLLLAAYPDPAQRRLALTAVGPLFLPNEVWLVASVGVLFGAFPRLEGDLLSGYYPAVVTALAGVVVVTVAFQLRSRPSGARARTGWDRAIIAGSALAAMGWGAFVGGVLQGHQQLTPFVATCALALLALVALHGATFLGRRLPAERAARPAATAKRLVPVALVAVALAAVTGLLTERVRQNSSLATVGLLAVLALLIVTAGRYAGRRRAFAASAGALVLPVVLLGLSLGGTAIDLAAPPATLRLLSWLAVPAVPVLIGFQAMCWWVFRGRVDGRAPVYW